MHLFGDLFVTGNGAAVDRIIEKTPNDARYFAGFVGWECGELAKELKDGYWYVAEPDAALLFKQGHRGHVGRAGEARRRQPAARGRELDLDAVHASSSAVP